MTRQKPALLHARTLMRWLLAVFYFSAGLLHLIRPNRFLPIIPNFVPKPYETVLATGIFEIIGSFALLTVRLQWLAGMLLAIYAICVFPANIKHAAAEIHVPLIPDSWWYHGPRLALQPVLIWWALYATDVIDWPWRKRSDSLSA
jgi:uncharacterized membrane protein